MQASHQSLLNPFSPPLSYIMGANRQAQFIIASPNHFSTFTVETISSFRERGHNPLLRGQSYAAGKPVESMFTHISYWFHSLRSIFSTASGALVVGGVSDTSHPIPSHPSGDSFPV